MKNFEIHKKKFDTFLDKINEDERVGILAHANCPDGMISTVFLIEILKKKFPKMRNPYVGFISYSKGILDKYESIFNREGVSKVFILDAGLDIDLLDELEKFMSKFEVLLNDHHPVNSSLKINDNIIKTNGDDCTSLVIYEFGKNILTEKSWVE
jgi:single-stranded DNA-specific DHH superfamily exonuclease